MPRCRKVLLYGSLSTPRGRKIVKKSPDRRRNILSPKNRRNIMMMAHTPRHPPCLDFIVVGEADCTGGLSMADIGTSLLNHNPTRAQVRPVVMTSNNAKAQDFYLRHATGTLCSAALTSRDITWMEQTSGLKAGALFKAFKQATSAGAPTVCQLA